MQSAKFTLDKKVVSVSTQKTIGRIREFIVDPDTGKIVAFKLKTNLFKKLLSVLDVLEYQSEKLLVHSEQRLLNEEDLPRIKQIKELRIRVWKAKAFSENGNLLGVVDDLIFDEHTGEIIKYYISQPLFLNPIRTHLVVGRGDILSIEKKGLIVRDLRRKKVSEALA